MCRLEVYEATIITWARSCFTPWVWPKIWIMWWLVNSRPERGPVSCWLWTRRVPSKWAPRLRCPQNCAVCMLFSKRMTKVLPQILLEEGKTKAPNFVSLSHDTYSCTGHCSSHMQRSFVIIHLLPLGILSVYLHSWHQACYLIHCHCYALQSWRYYCLAFLPSLYICFSWCCIPVSIKKFDKWNMLLVLPKADGWTEKI